MSTISTYCSFNKINIDFNFVPYAIEISPKMTQLIWIFLVSFKHEHVGSVGDTCSGSIEGTVEKYKSRLFKNYIGLI